MRYTAVVTSYSDANTNDLHSKCYFGVLAGNKGNVYIALPKLEKGTIDTPWTPAPEDIGVCVVNGKPVDKVYSNGNQVYGRNLLKNTSDFSSNWSSDFSVSTTTEYDGHPSMVFTSSPNSWKLGVQAVSLGKLQNSTQYTISFWAKADNAGDKAHTE